jgi:hypothetical protein
MNNIFWEDLDDFVVIYLEEILIFPRTKKKATKAMIIWYWKSCKNVDYMSIEILSYVIIYFNR